MGIFQGFVQLLGDYLRNLDENLKIYNRFNKVKFDSLLISNQKTHLDAIFMRKMRLNRGEAFQFQFLGDFLRKPDQNLAIYNGFTKVKFDLLLILNQKPTKTLSFQRKMTLKSKKNSKETVLKHEFANKLTLVKKFPIFRYIYECIFLAIKNIGNKLAN